MVNDMKLRCWLSVVCCGDTIEVYSKGELIAKGTSEKVSEELVEYLDYNVKFFSSSPVAVNGLIVAL